MAAILKVPNEEEWAVLVKYLDNEGCIIFPPRDAEALAKALNMEIMDVPREIEGKLIEYDFGGQPDVYLDIAYQGTFAYESAYDELRGEECDGKGEYECADCGSTYHPTSECPKPAVN